MRGPASRLVVIGMAACGIAGCAGGTAPAARVAYDTEAAWWPEETADRWYPVAALITATGEIVVAETRQNRIFRLGRPGNPPERVAAPTGGVVEWTALAGAPGLSFYALDGPGLRVHQFDLNGNYVGTALDLSAVARDQGLGAVDPGGLAVSTSGQAIVTDRRGDRILVFGSDWEFTAAWGQSGLSLGSWRRPSAAAADPEGRFLVVDEGNQRLVLLDNLGGIVSYRDLDAIPRGVAVLDRGRYVVTLADRLVLLGRGLDSEGGWPVPQSAACAGTPHFTSAVAGDRDRVLAGEGCSGRLLRWEAPGP